MKLFLLAGAGASYELGVPTMDPMVDEFWTYLSRTTLTEDEINLLQEDLTDSATDMEAIVEVARNIVEADETTAGLQADIEGPEQVSLFRKLQREAEWFVQNVCRRVDFSDAQLLWKPTLDALSDHKATIATSNYDRAIEIAADRTDINLFGGFRQFGDGETAEWQGMNGNHDFELLKMHGSLDWFKTDEDVLKLRHPLSLYGELELTVNGTQELENCLILPSMEKQKRESPFMELNTRMRQAATDSDVAIFLGSSLRDPDLGSLARLCDDQIPTFTVSPDEGNADLPGAHIQATASEFLISMLPAAIERGSVEDHLGGVAEQEREAPTILQDIDRAFDLTHNGRAESIENLADNKIQLQPGQVQELLEDNSACVRKYGLALVDDCFDPEDLKKLVEDISENDPDQAVRDEADLLLEYLWDTPGEEVEAEATGG